ncbi:hypothetical protein BJV82DRAFT_616493 [Fennellomyces sp. T-0311]|nr:hypothetical protein BJV82DRAFT_616493 [Fennellomyces sp. T-0311]
MPLKTRARKGTGRRGRPKKYPRPTGEAAQQAADHQAPARPSLSLSTHPPLDTNGPTAVRPREERSYKDYFPNLNLKEPLRIVRVSKQDREDVVSNGVVDTNSTHRTLSADDQTHVFTEQPSEQPRESSDESELSSISVIESPDDTQGTPNHASSPSSSQASKNNAMASYEHDEKSNDSSDDPSEKSNGNDDSTPEERNADPLVDHHKEGDLYQALSTRPQPHLPISVLTMGVNLDALPKPSFRLVKEDDVREEEGNQDSEGQDTEDLAEGVSVQHHRFQRPENHYIRYIEPSEADLMETVEYDMDEHDDVWLQMLNEERRKEDLGEVSGDLFEAVMDQLEKEWFDLIKNLPKQLAEEPSLPEDSACAICDDTECENSNAIVFCDGCNLAVHQDCYGIPYIPEGQWLCRKCLVSPENPVSCIFCPNEGGAFKQTNTNKWGHLLCAIWIPEVGLSNSVYMEPIDNIENIPKSRWKLTCYICRRRHGACIQCDSKHCFVAFHVTCARWARLCMRMKSHGSHYDGVVFKAYCDKHTPRDYLDQVNVEQTVASAQAFFTSSGRRSKAGAANHRTPRQRYVDGEITSDVTDDENERKKKLKKKRRMNDNSAVTQMLPSSKAARAHQHHYSAGAPIAPEYIISKLENLRAVRQATNLRRKSQLVVSICRYWSLKRESRRGAPLLKRLHLEPWTASSSQHKQTEVEKAHRAAAMMNLRADLERVRMLSEQVQKREKQKLERIRKQKAYLETILFPIEYLAKPLVDQLIDMDKKELFRYPVTPDVAPDYTEIIDTPMSFADILDKFSLHEYTSLDQVKTDVMLIWKNCMTYNKPETLYYRTAERLEKVSTDLFGQAQRDYDNLEVRKETGVLALDIHPEIFTYNTVHIPTPEEIAAEKERVEAEEKAKAEEEAKQKLSAEKAEARRQADAERRRAKAAQAEAKKKKRQEQAEARKEKALADAANAEAEGKCIEATPQKEDKPKDENNRVVTRSVATTLQQQTTTKDKSGRRRTRSMGSDGLVAPTAEELEKRSSTEARNLLWHSDRITDSGPVKLDRKRKAPPGWRYVEETGSSSDTDESSPRKKPRTSSRSTPRSKPEPIKSIEHRMIVWARVKGFPPHPARIIDPTEEDIGKHVLHSKHGEDDVLVEFYEVPDHHKWGWVTRTDIFSLGDPRHDTDMLLMARKKKNSRRIKESRTGYAFACGVLGLDPAPALDASVPSKK